MDFNSCIRGAAWCILFLWIVLGTDLLAQDYWLKDYGGTDAELASAMTSDGNGAVYTIGTFSGNAVFGSFNLSSNGRGDIFIMKTSAVNGNVLWVRQIGSSGEDNGYGITCDLNGNLFCTGRFTGNVSFGNYQLTATGGFDAFIARIDPSTGLVKWAVRQGGTGSDAAMALCADASGGLYSCGYFQSTGSFGTSTLSAIGSTSKAYLVKLDTTAGSITWAECFGSSGYTFPLSITFGGGNELYLSGQFDGAMQLGTTTLTALNFSDGFVCRVSTQSGYFKWAQSFGGNGEDVVSTVAAGKNGQLFIGGKFEETMTAGSYAPVSAGAGDGFVCSLDTSSGTPLWLKTVGGESVDQVNNITTDVSGDIFVIGQFNGICNIGPASLASNGNTDIFVLRMDPTGGFTWWYRMGGGLADSGVGVFCDNSDAVFCIGNFRQSIRFENQQIPSSGSTDIFLLKVNELSLGITGNPHDLAGLRVFPNPVKDWLFIETNAFDSQKITLIISDALGNECVYKNTDLKEFQLDLSKLPPAIYFLKLVLGEQCRTVRLIKE